MRVRIAPRGTTGRDLGLAELVAIPGDAGARRGGAAEDVEVIVGPT